jgi:hypothetical protein
MTAVWPPVRDAAQASLTNSYTRWVIMQNDEIWDLSKDMTISLVPSETI